MTTTPFQLWLKTHLKDARAHYKELCKLDDREMAIGGSSAYYEKSHQIFGYIAALEKCQKESAAASSMSPTQAKARARKTTPAKRRRPAKKR